MTAPAIWQRWNSWLLLAFVALLIVVPWGYALIPLLAVGVALVGTPFAGRRGYRPDLEDAGWCLVLLLFAGCWLWDVWRTGHWPVGEQGQGIGLPLWPLVAAGLLIWWRRYPPRAAYWWLGIAWGAIGAGVIALFERLVLQQPRAGSAINAIPFGDLALLLGFLALLALLWWSSRLPRRVGRRLHGSPALALVAALAGLGASLLSGTRGGWLAAPLLFGMLLLAWRIPSGPGWPRAIAWRWLAVAMAPLLVVAALPQAGVADRLLTTVEEAHAYWQGTDRASSVGVRLEMWRAGARLFAERPLTGWGEGRLEAARDAMVAQGILHPGVSHYDQLHSDLIDTAARRGLVGLATLLLLYGVPLVLFARRLGHAHPAVRLLAVAGMMVVVAFVAFGLTQSMLRDERGLSGYLGLVVACWVLLRREEEVAAMSAGGAARAGLGGAGL